MKSQIAAAFGDDIFEAVTSSQLWNQETGEIETRYIKADIYLAQLMVVTLTVGWISYYNFVISIY